MSAAEENPPPRGAFDDIATEHHLVDAVPDAWPAPPPDGMQPLLEVWRGVQLRPKSLDGHDVEFGSCFGNLCADGIEQLSTALNRTLYPVAALAERTGLLLMDPGGACFTVSVDSNDACSLGSAREAVRVMLLGGFMRPLLPERDHPQWHNMEVYVPGDDRVHWIKSDDWWDDTRAGTGS